MDDINGDPPLEVDPYAVLEIETTATANEVKTAYRKLALQHHPDKALPEQREEAKIKFQEIAFAYAILSDERRRRRYDTTGNTSESLDIEDDDFNWLDFFRAQWAETVTTQKIEGFQKSYQESDEERSDVLAAYTRFKGDMNHVFNEVILSNPLHDEDRFRRYINDAIAAEEVNAYDAFVKEPEKKRTARLNKAKKEAQMAEKHAEDLGLNGKGKRKKNEKAEKAGGGFDLAAMIQQRQKGRAANFLDDLEAKYATTKSGKGKAQNGKGKKTRMDEPPEEAFQKTAARKKKDEKVEVDEAEEDSGDEEDSDMEDFVSEDEEDDVRPRKRRKAPAKTKARR